ncbi:MAG: tetratricopeptide repeat protein [Candidatus Rokubacteria bacterium]|nr:tetratricopeptide repeat protein [Candidatus Rokubacteria bacterium]
MNTERIAGRPLVLPVLVFTVAFVAFLPGLSGQFLDWDDGGNFLRNPNFRGLGWSNLRWMFTTTLMGHWIPLTWLTLGANYVIGGMAPWGYHLGNVLLHAANAVVFYAVARRLLAAGAGGERAQGAVAWGAAAAAAVFAVHPLRVESVAWVTERRDVLSGFFFLLAVLGYLKAVERGAGGRLDSRWRAVSLGLFAAALSSKASTMMLPVALLVLDVYPLQRRGVGVTVLLREKIGYFVLAGVGAVVALVAVRQGATVTGYAEYGVGARAVMTLYSLMFYPWKFLWPVDLSPMYELPARVEPLAWRFLLPMVAVPVITTALLLLRRRWPGGLAAWVYSALLVLPVSGAVHAGYQLAHDRYSYLSGLGFAVLAGAAVVWVIRAGARGVLRPWLEGVVLGAMVLMVATLGAGAWRQSRVWHDSETLWRWAAGVDPACMVCQSNLGNLLLEQDRLAEAETAFRAAVTARPESAGPRNNLGAVLIRRGRYDEAAAQFREAMRLAPDRIGGAFNLGLLYVVQGKFAEALPLLRHVLAQRPDRPVARAALSTALVKRADELRREGRPGEADLLVRESAALARDRSQTEAVPKAPPGSR